MTPLNKLLKYASITLGLLSAGFFIFDYGLFTRLQPRMVQFEPISTAEDNLFLVVGLGLVLFLVFYLLSLFRVARYLKMANRIMPLYVILMICGVISLLLVFSDWALLTDIHKQYGYGLSQPEWALVYPIMGFQFITAAVMTYLHTFGFKEERLVSHVVRDSNIFLIVQYVGVICGGMGLALSSLSFFYPKGWNVNIHVTMTLVIMLFPYGLAVTYWLITKLQEENQQWYDEKQQQDVGRSAFGTLLLSVVIMTVLFYANYGNLGGVVSVVWLPLYLYSVLFLFSLGNLYFTNKP